MDIEGPFVGGPRERVVDCGCAESVSFWREERRRSPRPATAEVETDEGRGGRPRRAIGFVLAGREGVWISLVRRMLTLGFVPVELVRYEMDVSTLRT